MNKTAKTVPSEQIDSAKLMQAGFAQCAFIALQTMAFPELGVVGGIVAAQCAIMPWAVPIFKKAPAMAVAMSLTSAVMSPIFSLICMKLIEVSRLVTVGLA